LPAKAPLQHSENKEQIKMQILEQQYITNQKGKKTAVILPIKIYEQLMEDLHDLAIIAERKSEQPSAKATLLQRNAVPQS
jgi:PHD/YefM family antitoxin component YafN of YafNO toxin-antitoxin module